MGVAAPFCRRSLLSSRRGPARRGMGLNARPSLKSSVPLVMPPYIIYCPFEGEDFLNEAALDELRKILSGVASALATFLPLMRGAEDCPLIHPRFTFARWTDSMLFDSARSRGCSALPAWSDTVCREAKRSTRPRCEWRCTRASRNYSVFERSGYRFARRKRVKTTI